MEFIEDVIEKYSKLYTEALVYDSCSFKTNRLVIGGSDRDWGYVNHIRWNKHLNLSGAKIEKQSIIYTTAILHKSRVKESILENMT